MTHHVVKPEYQDCLEYHGNTAVELTRVKEGSTVLHRWIIFDSVREAQDYFYEFSAQDGCHV